MNMRLLLIAFLLTCISLFAQNKQGLDIPPRPSDAPEGSEFMNSIKNMSFSDREDAILEQLLAGNIPSFMRELVELEANFNDADGNSHQVKYWVMPDYLAIGSDSNYCRVPMGPITAQKAANAFGATMPTRKLVDNIYQNAEIKLAPVTYAPVGNQNERVEKFIEHNNDIQNQFEQADGEEGELVGGTKKDVVISNKIVDQSRPDHVVIYGWHRLNGQPIQPLTNIHVNTYVDYSHGIRFLDSDILIDGDTTTVQEVLKDEQLYKILSDEVGPMYYPTYIYEIKTPSKPKSFGIKANGEGSIKVILNPDSVAESYNLYVSPDGENFGNPVQFTSGEFEYDGFPADSIIFIRLTAENSFGSSGFSEVLATYTKPTARPKMLIVNGFDRTSDGNTFNFIRQHARAIVNSNVQFESATNEAVEDGLFKLSDYHAADYILGEESKVDETFSDKEQQLAADYLESGRGLFVSGAEIAWDLDYKGSSSDKAFFNNYLKAGYSADAPGGVSGSHYSAEGVIGEMFGDLTDISFDDGTHGTYDVEYADALIPQNGAKEILHYKNVNNHKTAGISYEGTFGSGDSTGRLVYMGFPFETIYPAAARQNMMGKVIDFFYGNITSVDQNLTITPKDFYLAQNYPNPFNPITTIRFTLPEASQVQLRVFNPLGELVGKLVDRKFNAGVHNVKFDASNLTSGIYIYRIEVSGENGKEFNKSRKMTILK